MGASLAGAFVSRAMIGLAGQRVAFTASGKLAEGGLLLAGGRGVDPLVRRGAEPVSRSGRGSPGGPSRSRRGSRKPGIEGMPSLSVVQARAVLPQEGRPPRSPRAKPNRAVQEASTNHLKPTGTSARPPAEVLRPRGRSSARDERLADRGVRSPAGAVGGRGTRSRPRVVVRVSGGPAAGVRCRGGPCRRRCRRPRRSDPSRPDEGSHRVRGRAVHPILPSPVEGHDRRRWRSTTGFTTSRADPVPLGDPGPIIDRRPPSGSTPTPELRPRDRPPCRPTFTRYRT